MSRIPRHHWIGLLVGALVGVSLAALGDLLGYALALSDGLLWGGVVGGVLAGIPQFAQSGAVLTRSENQALNAIVGIVAGLALIGALTALVLFLTHLFS